MKFTTILTISSVFSDFKQLLLKGVRHFSVNHLRVQGVLFQFVSFIFCLLRLVLREVPHLSLCDFLRLLLYMGVFYENGIYLFLFIIPSY